MALLYAENVTNKNTGKNGEVMSVKNDVFGNRMKDYEMAEAGRKLMPLVPIIARIDGRGFSKFTKGLERPYDLRLSKLMVDTTKYLVHETNACCGYTQSDEITLGWYSPEYGSEIFFDGRISKMTSTLAALASVYFNRELPGRLPPEYVAKMPTFDSRVWNVPNIIEGANAFLWREQDATKNSISMAARAYYSHKELIDKNGSEMQEMLFQKSINWNDYPQIFRRGAYIQKVKVLRKFSVDEIQKLPAKHEARSNPELMIERTDIRILENLPPLSKIINRSEVIFLGAEYKIKENGG